MSSPNVVIVGGGAAGLFAAIAGAETHRQGRFTVLERGSQPLSKVLVSGGGRCNVTHACFEPRALITHYPRGGSALLGPFHRFQPRDAMDWFESHGVPLKTEPDGRVFPVSDRSESVAQSLLSAALKSGVDLRLNVDVKTIQKHTGTPFVVTLGDGETLRADRLVLATGGSPQGHAWAKSLGHTVQAAVPALFSFTVPDDRLRGLSGVSVAQGEIQISGTSFRQEGPLLITHTGLSGPAVIALSSWGARVLNQSGYKGSLVVRWRPGSLEETVERLKSFRTERARQGVGTCPFPDIPRRLWDRLVMFADVPADGRWADLSKTSLTRLAQEISAGVYTLTGKSPFKEEFVTCGGVTLDEVNFKTMESRRQPGLFFAGEILDIDGVTGGFNFQNAWTTGWLTGQNLIF